MSELALVQLICRSAGNCRVKGHSLAAWAASRRARPTAPHPPRSLSIINVPAGYAQFAGRLILGVPWALKVDPVDDVCCGSRGWRVCRRSTVTARRMDRLHAGMDPPKPRGCTFHRTAGLPSLWVVWAVRRPSARALRLTLRLSLPPALAGGSGVRLPGGCLMDNSLFSASEGAHSFRQRSNAATLPPGHPAARAHRCPLPPWQVAPSPSPWPPAAVGRRPGAVRPLLPPLPPPPSSPRPVEATQARCAHAMRVHTSCACTYT